MTTPQKVLSKAAGEIGYYAPDDPEPGSKYGRWMADYTGESWLRGPSVEVWWCAIFVSWCYVTSGGKMPGMPNYNCDNLRSKARDYKLGNKRDAQPGDFVLFDWDGNGSCNHIGLVELNCGGYLQTIEGNTSGSANGRQSNGNGVWRRTRNWSSVNCVIRPIYTGDDDMPLNGDDINKINDSINGSWKLNDINNGVNDVKNSVNDTHNAINNVGNSINESIGSLTANLQEIISRVDLDVPHIISGNKMYRVVSPTGQHLWTAAEGERNALVEQGWKDEGGWNMQLAPFIYRLYNPYNNDHMLTADAEEASALLNAGWHYEGVAGVSSDEDGAPVYRVYNSYDGQHVYTTSEDEVKGLVKAGWTDEGAVFYAEPEEAEDEEAPEESEEESEDAEEAEQPEAVEA